MIYNLISKVAFASLLISSNLSYATAQAATYMCPDYTGFNNTLTTFASCTGCDICPDGITTCPGCINGGSSNPVDPPTSGTGSSLSGVCPDYLNNLNQTVIGETCQGCNICGDGSFCSVCDGLTTGVPSESENNALTPSSNPTTLSPTIHVQKFAICPDFYDNNLNKLVTGLGCSDCQYCGDGSVCPACPTQNPSSLPTTVPSFARTDEPTTQPSLTPTSELTLLPTDEPTTQPSLASTDEPTSVPTNQQTKPSSDVCPDYFLNGNLVSREACSGCELCGDGSICGACPVTTPEGVCPTYINSQNVLVKGAVCKGCDKCGDGSTCVVCSDYHALIGISSPPTSEPTLLPPSSEPTSAPTIEQTQPGSDVCPDYFLNGNLVTGEACSGCELCGDGSICGACPVTTPEGVCPTYINSQNVLVKGAVCKGCDKCGDGSTCVVCSDYYALIGISSPPTSKPTLLPPSSEPTSAPTIEQTQPGSDVCPDYFLNGNLVSREACSGCELCGDGSICGACPVTTPEGVCPTYINSQNVLVKGAVCKGCDKCGDGSTCVVCSDYYALIGISSPPTSEPTLLPPSSEPTSAPTIEQTQPGSDVCPDYFLNGNLVSREACSGCELCGDGSICGACPVTTPEGVCPTYINSDNVPVKGAVCKGCDKCGDGSTCVVCSDYYAIIGTSAPPTSVPSSASTLEPSYVPTIEPSATAEPPTSSSNNVPTNEPISNTQTPPVVSQSTQKPNTIPSTGKPVLPSNPISTQAPTGDAGANHNSNTISTGSAVGIAVGGFVFAALCMAFLVYVCCFMGNKDKKGKTVAKDEEFDSISASEKDFGMSSNTLGDMESARSTTSLMV